MLNAKSVKQFSFLFRAPRPRLVDADFGTEWSYRKTVGGLESHAVDGGLLSSSLTEENDMHILEIGADQVNNSLLI